MKEEQEILLEKWFDGEATPAETISVEELLEKDVEARSFLKDLRNLRDATESSFESNAAQPSWANFSSRLEKPARAAMPFSNGAKRLVGLTAIVLLGMALWMPFRYIGHPSPDEVELVDRVEVLETDLEGAMPIVYLDQPSGWTVVWVLESEDPQAGS